jgi:hypothetical protein
MSPKDDHFRIDYMSMMIDYLVQIMTVSPPELWRD